MTELSPQPQAVLDAADSAFDQAGTTRQGIAAALRAAAEQGKLGPDHWAGSHPDQRELGWSEAMTWLEDVAAELEGGSEAHALAAEARAALAQPEPPADGEVTELVAWLRTNADYSLQKAATATFKHFHRIADLLERLAQPEPEGPTDEEVISAAAKAGFAYECAGGLFNSYIDSADIKPDVLSFARDLLARWGNSAKPEPQGALEEHYEWELEDASGEWVAGGSANDQEAVHQEGMRYLSAYSQDGPHKLTIRRHQVHTVLQAPASVTDELPLD